MANRFHSGPRYINRESATARALFKIDELQSSMFAGISALSSTEREARLWGFDFLERVRSRVIKNEPGDLWSEAR